MKKSAAIIILTVFAALPVSADSKSVCTRAIIGSVQENLTVLYQRAHQTNSRALYHALQKTAADATAAGLPHPVFIKAEPTTTEGNDRHETTSDGASILNLNPFERIGEWSTRRSVGSWSSSLSTYATGSDHGRIRVFDFAGKKSFRSFPNALLTFSPEGSYVLGYDGESSGVGGTAARSRFKKSPINAVLPTEAELPKDFPKAIDESGRYALAANRENFTFHHVGHSDSQSTFVQTMAQLSDLKFRGIDQAKFSDNGRYFIFTYQGGYKAEVWDTVTGGLVTRIADQVWPIRTIKISGDGSVVGILIKGSGLRFFDTVSAKVVAEFDPGSSDLIYSFAMLDNGSEAFVSHLSKQIDLVNLSDLSVKEQIHTQYIPTEIDFSPTTQTLKSHWSRRLQTGVEIWKRP
jgi:WD40 repeat protein